MFTGSMNEDDKEFIYKYVNVLMCEKNYEKRSGVPSPIFVLSQIINIKPILSTVGPLMEMGVISLRFLS